MENLSEMETKIAQILNEYGYVFRRTYGKNGSTITLYSSGDFEYTTEDTEVLK